MDDETIRRSIPSDAMEKLPSLTGARFADPALERLFQIENFDVNVSRFTRYSVPLAVAGIFLYGIHDYLVLPAMRTTAWLIRYGLFGPIGLFTILFVFRNRSPRLHQIAILVFGLGAVMSVIGIASLAPLEGFFLYTGFTAIFVTVGPFVGRMNVRTQALYTAITIALYLLVEGTVGHHPLIYRFSYLMGVGTMGLIGCVLAHQMDVQARLAFLQRRVIREQMAELEVERHRSESLLLNVLPRRIADRLKRADEKTIADHFESATVLFSDIVGFTEMSSRLKPEEIVRRLDEVFSRFDAIADSLGLEKIKTIGDAYMVAGGVPSARGDHAEAVLEMALRMREVIAELAKTSDDAMELRIGVHTGPVVAGVIGKKKFIYDVWGDTVNCASRMESHGLPGAIQVSEATYGVTKDRFDFEARGAIKVKGKGEMSTYFLVGRREVTGREALV